MRYPITGVRVDGDKVVISVKGGNEMARWLCGQLISDQAEPTLLAACLAYLSDREEAGCTADSAAVKAMRTAVAKATETAEVHLDLCASTDDTMPGYPNCDCGAK